MLIVSGVIGIAFAPDRAARELHDDESEGGRFERASATPSRACRGLNGRAAVAERFDGGAQLGGRLAVAQRPCHQLRDRAEVARAEAEADELLGAQAQRGDRAVGARDLRGREEDPGTLQAPDGPVAGDRIRQRDGEVVGLGEAAVGARDDQARVAQRLRRAPARLRCSGPRTRRRG